MVPAMKLPGGVALLTGGVLAATAVQAAPVALEQLVTPDDAVWKLTADEFLSAHHPHGFAWMSAAQDVARSVHPELQFCGLRVWEALARFDQGQLKELTFYLYNRGDAGTLPKFQFEALTARAEDQLNRWTGARPTTFREPDRGGAATVRRQAWRKGPHRLDLTWSFTAAHGAGLQAVPYRAEYVRLDVAPVRATSDPNLLFGKPAMNPLRTLTIADLWQRVQRAPNGDVLVTGVPMVDQGPKGYCAVAVSERLMRYYGGEVDQHEFAQFAQTGARGGTTPRGLLTALRELGDRLRLDVTVLQDFDFSEFKMLVRDYNSLARQARQPEITFGPVVDLAEIYEQMDLGLLRQARQRREGALKDFRAAVTKHINAGVPLAWGVLAGKVAEQPAVKGFGGHMRLITGYNDRVAEIIYSDTWGAGHEVKRLPLTDAWTITLGLYSVTPRNLRF
jgi:hypothetical protein